MSSARTAQSSRRKRVIVVPVQSPYARTPRFAMSAVDRMITISPTERTPMNNEAIYSLLRTWSSFTSAIQIEKTQRDICGVIQYERHKDGTLLYKPGDITDGWYFIFKGMCIFVEESSTEPTDPIEKLPAQYMPLLYHPLHPNKHYRVVSELGVSEDFGKDGLKHGSFQTQFCITVGETALLRIDPYSYKFIFSSYTHSMIDKKANVILQVQKLGVLMDHNDITQRLASKLKECRIDAGYVISKENPITKGFLIVQEGLIQIRRFVDFSKIHIDKDLFEIGDVVLPIPSGLQQIPSERLSNSTIFALPLMYNDDSSSFICEVLRDSLCYIVEYEDFFAYVPMTLQIEILNRVVDSRSDEQVFLDWLAKQKSYQWRLYKKRCEKEARCFNKATKNGSADEIIYRIPKPPKALKTYRPFKRNVLPMKTL